MRRSIGKTVLVTVLKIRRHNKTRTPPEEKKSEPLEQNYDDTYLLPIKNTMRNSLEACNIKTGRRFLAGETDVAGALRYFMEEANGELLQG